MKKLLTLVLALAMTLSLAACGGGGEDTADEGSEGSTSGEPTKMTLILRGGAYGESLEAMLPAFEEEHNVDIEVMLMSFDDLHTGIALDAVNEVGTYDLCMVDGSWMAEFTENGVLANLSELGYSFDEDIVPATTEICTLSLHYALPISSRAPPQFRHSVRRTLPRSPYAPPVCARLLQRSGRTFAGSRRASRRQRG